MNFSNVASVMQMAYQYQNRTQKTSVNGNSFTNSLQEASGANVSKVDAYTEQLRAKYGNVMIMNVGKDQNSMDNLGMGTAGYSNVVIAPNILEQMANDPEKAAYYEKKIQDYYNCGRQNSEMAAALIGHRVTSDGLVIHEDGTVTHYTSIEEDPKEVAKFEAAQKEKREKKAEERRRNIERSEGATAERRRIAENQYHAHLMEQMRNSQIYDSSVGNYIVGQTQPVALAVSAYEKAISTMSISMIQGI